MHSILIKNGLLIDGSGSPPRPLDLAIDGARIARLCKRDSAEGALTINAEGKVVCPGFIDIHSHSDLTVLGHPMAESRIMQGVTTELVGNCGTSAAPLAGTALTDREESARRLCIDTDWSTMDEYLLRVANLKTSVNIATLVGHETVRKCVMGDANREPSAEEMLSMKSMVADAMLQGAFGLSTGLIYAPGMYASTQEIIELASVVASFGGIYASHIRGESSTVVQAVEEAIQIGRGSNAPVEISHHKACGRKNWGKVNETLRLIESALAEGTKVGFDVYPYTAGSTSLDTVLPPWVRDGGKPAMMAHLKDSSSRARIAKELAMDSDEWENSVAEDGWESIVVVDIQTKENRRFENRSVASIATELGKSPADVIMDLVLQEDAVVAAIFHDISEDDVERVISHPLACVGSDGSAMSPHGPYGSSCEHPRNYGTFPRAIRRYSIDKKLFPIQEAIGKMTSLPASRLGLADRGTLAAGHAADVVVFDPERIADKATFDKPHQYPEGVDFVLVNGAVTVENGKHTKERAGVVLRHKPSIA